MEEQLIFKRREIKYLISKSQLEYIKQKMSTYMKTDEHGCNTILSLYYDTPDFRLIRKSLEHPVYKEKLRLRSYGRAKEDTKIFVELKKKYESVVYKRRMEMTEMEAEDYFKHGRKKGDSQIFREIDYFLKIYHGIKPMVLISYEREAFYAKDDHEFRITFDDNILWRNHNLTLCGEIYGNKILEPDTVLMEIKAADAIPLWLVKLLSENNIYQTSFSKYGTAYAAIYDRHLTSSRHYGKTTELYVETDNNKTNGEDYKYA